MKLSRLTLFRCMAFPKTNYEKHYTYSYITHLMPKLKAKVNLKKDC